MKTALSLLIVTTLVFAFGASAQAESPKRSGLTGLIGMGIGISEKYGGILSTLELGYMISPDTAVMLGTSGISVASGASGAGGGGTISGATLGMKRWLTNRTWVKGDAGPVFVGDHVGGTAIASAGFDMSPAGALGLSFVLRTSLNVFEEAAFTDAGLMLAIEF